MSRIFLQSQVYFSQTGMLWYKKSYKNLWKCLPVYYVNIDHNIIFKKVNKLTLTNFSFQ